MTTFVPAIVVGAGYAGLAASHHLSRAGIEHLVLERGRVGETWRSQRWDSFALNTSRRISSVPAQPYTGPNPEGFALRDEVVAGFEAFVAARRLPVRSGSTVASLDVIPGTGALRLCAGENGESEVFEARDVIVASGFQNVPVMPQVSAGLPPGVTQVHVGGYHNPRALPPGAVLVVGSAQSGCQIAEDLLEAGRRVFLSVSAVARVPRRYRGRDIVDWMIDTGFWDVRVQDLEDPRIQFAEQPQVSGIGPLGRTVSLQALARKGAILVGRLVGADGGAAVFDAGVAACVRFADERSAFFKRMIDKHIERNGIAAPPQEPDAADMPDDGTACGTPPSRLNLRDEGIGAIVWCTGFRGDFRWIHAPVFGPEGRPAHERGVSRAPGIYFLGAPWLHKRKSGVLYGMSEDAEYIVSHIVERMAAQRRRVGFTAPE